MMRLSTPLLLLFPFLAAQAQPWETRADLPVELVFPVVVELNGEIHVIGGGGPGGATDLHLRYTPYTDTWDTLAPVPYLAQQPCGAVVDGKIHYCAGGYPNTGTPLDDHYIYDPAADSWYAAASLPFPTAINEAASLDGKLYVLAGQPDKFLCQSYDPGIDLWSPHNALPDDKFWYGAIVSNGNTIYRFGGGGYINPTNIAHEYDKVNDSWNILPDLFTYVHAPAGTNIGASHICISGGYSGGTESDAVWLYDIAAQTYTALDPLPVPRVYHAMVTVDGCVYSVGGNNGVDPSIGVSLLRNCTIGTAINESEGQRPYTAIFTPTSAHLTLDPSMAASATVEVLDVQGRRIILRTLDAGDGPLVIASDRLGTGVFNLNITIGSRRYVERWVVSAR